MEPCTLCIPARALSATRRTGRSTSDAPCRAPGCTRRPMAAERYRSTRTAFAVPPSRDTASDGPKRLPSTGAPRRRFHAAPREPATGTSALPPKTWLPTSSSLAERSRAAELDPAPYPMAHHPRTDRTERRLSTSATDSTCEHLAKDRSNPAHHTCGLPRAQLLVADSQAPRGMAGQCVTGQGPARYSPCNARLLSPRSLAERASPQPDRIGHLLSLTAWLEKPG